ncbi:MAG: hypothetical protein AB7G87_01385 [Clostridia bacterium]
MKRDEIGKISVLCNDLKIEISGNQDSSCFMSQDLLLRSVLALLNFDFKWMKEKDFQVADKYFITILDKLGQIIKAEAGEDYRLDNLLFIKHYLEWATDQNVCNDPALVEFIKVYQESEDED